MFDFGIYKEKLQKWKSISDRHERLRSESVKSYHARKHSLEPELIRVLTQMRLAEAEFLGENDSSLIWSHFSDFNVNGIGKELINISLQRSSCGEAYYCKAKIPLKYFEMSDYEIFTSHVDWFITNK